MPASILLFALIGGIGLAALMGDGVLGIPGAVLGATLGYARALSLRMRLLERRLRDLEARSAQDSPPRTEGEAPGISAHQAAPRPQAAIAPTASEPTRREPPPGLSEAADPRPRGDAPGPTGDIVTAADWLNAAWSRARDFLGRGNPVVNVGMVVLFFGVAFLVKYAAERDLIPIELRLSGVALGGLAMLVVGWRLRTRSTLYAMVLQGGGVGVLYLTVYAAAKLFALLPAGLALAVMVALIAFSGLFAVLQNALPLAFFGTAGGFLAPVLASTGSGSHVMLFSYYALLNAGVLGIAWFRSWRLLNLTGFLFTFVIGGLWGYRYYRPAHFATMEPFLVLFFLFYVAIAVLFARRQPLALRGYVDGGLVFGVPVVGFALQAALVRDMPYGLALSALTLGGFYLALATVLWRRGPSHMRLLTEAFLALGVVFASLAIPLALDGRWTAAAWALEGAAMVWIGVRQIRRLTRSFGVLLQLAAGLMFVADSGGALRAPPVLNSVYLGSVMVAVAGLFSASYLQRNQDRLRAREGLFEPVLMVWSLLWWLGSGLSEIDRHLSGQAEADASVVFVALSALAAACLSRRLPWPRMSWPPVGLVPALGLTALGQFAGPASHPLGSWGLVVWPLVLAASYRVLWHLQSVWPERVVRYWHAMSLWLLLFLLSRELDWLLQRVIQGASTWRFVAWALVPGLAVALLWRFGRRISWPVRAHFSAYAVTALAPVALYLFGWTLAASLVPGSARPLPYVPAISPLDLAQAFALIALARWCVWLAAAEQRPAWWPADHIWKGALAAGAFLWMNTLVARSVHFWGGVPYDPRGLHHSLVFQAAVAILWTLTAFALMLWSRRRASRAPWLIGSGLLVAVVAKLFLVDLVGAGTVARIVSFLAVGVLMLLIGYFAPLPPRPPQAKSRP